MGKGRPRKRARATYNISGLVNQSMHASVLSESISQPTPPQSEADGEESDLEEDDECIFLPKFHCELNPIEMVRNYFLIS